MINDEQHHLPLNNPTTRDQIIGDRDVTDSESHGIGHFFEIWNLSDT